MYSSSGIDRNLDNLIEYDGDFASTGACEFYEYNFVRQSSAFKWRNDVYIWFWNQVRNDNFWFKNDVNFKIF